MDLSGEECATMRLVERLVVSFFVRYFSSDPLAFLLAGRLSGRTKIWGSLAL